MGRRKAQLGGKMSEQLAERRSVGGGPGVDEPAWVNEALRSRDAEELARESEERIAKLAEQQAAQFAGK